MNQWDELPQPEEITSSARGPVSQLLGRLLPGLVVGGVLWLLGRPTLAAFVVFLSAVLALASARSERVRAAFDRFTAAIAHWVGVALTTVLLLFVEVFVVAPVSLLSWVFQRDLLKPAGHPRRAGIWQPREGVADDSTVRRGFAREQPPEGSAERNWVVWLLPRVAGGFAILLALDLAVGWAWEEEAGGVHAAYDGSTLSDAAIRSSPWFDDYRGELASIQYDYVPFVNSAPRDFSGNYVNTVGGLRRSYEPADLPADALVVWFFGGSAIWGEGQRDDYTIPSEFARLAIDDGIAVRVVNPFT